MPKPKYPDANDGRFLSPEWDVLFGFMIGRLLTAGYTPAQLQAKVRLMADQARDTLRTVEGRAAGEQVKEGMDSIRKIADADAEDEES